MPQIEMINSKTYDQKIQQELNGISAQSFNEILTHIKHNIRHEQKFISNIC